MTREIVRLSATVDKDRTLNDMRIMGDRILAAAKREGLELPPVIFTLKSDQQVLDDLVYAGMPRHFRHWSYGKQAMRPRSGHVFEFALASTPGEIALGSTNNPMMQTLVTIHAWIGHLWMDHNNAINRESALPSVIQKFAQDERFVDKVIEKWGHERYEWYMDAAKALEYHSGWLPTNHDMPKDSEHRRLLENSLIDLEAAWHKAATEFDRKAIEEDVVDVQRMLKCHPIVPTDDLLGFLADEENTPQLPWEAHRLIQIAREEMRYHQAFMRTRYMHEGRSHQADTHFPWAPELDIVSLGFDELIKMSHYDTMHDWNPMDNYHDVYALGLNLMEYIRETTSKKVGTEVAKFFRLQKGEDGHLIETDIEVEKVVDKWDHSYLIEVLRTFTDRRFFETFITDESMKVINDKTLEWVRRSMAQMNKLLKERGWDPSLIFDPLPETLEDMYMAIQIWLNQRQMSGWIGQWYGYGAPGFPIHEYWLQQMLNVIQTVAEWDADKHAFKRQMLHYTEMSWLPNIRLVDSGRFSKAGMYTLRHEYDPDFGPLAQNDARETLRRFWRFGGPTQFLTWELLTDAFGRPWGPPRPYRYFTENGSTVKERWL
jgi:spore cortex formation protein SpoVR/YcgB (stage V sporulation)